jgi:hypothetical protein
VLLERVLESPNGLKKSLCEGSEQGCSPRFDAGVQ